MSRPLPLPSPDVCMSIFIWSDCRCESTLTCATIINVAGLGHALPMIHYERISEDISDAPTQALAQTD